MMAFVIKRYDVLAAVTVAAAGVQPTSWIPARGAFMVVFQWQGTNGNAPASETVEWNNIQPQPTGGAGGSAGSGALQSSTTSVVLNALGGIRQVVTQVATGTIPVRCIAHEYIRGVLTGHATLSITGVTCVAEVWYEDNAAAPVGGAAT